MATPLTGCGAALEGGSTAGPRARVVHTGPGTIALTTATADRVREQLQAGLGRRSRASGLPRSGQHEPGAVPVMRCSDGESRHGCSVCVAGRPAAGRDVAVSLRLPVCDDTLTPQRGPLATVFGAIAVAVRADGGAGIDAAGVTDAAGSPGSDSELRLSWAEQSPQTPVRVEAITFKPRVLRMNTIAAGGGYRWPTDVLRAIGVTDVQLGSDRDG